jgi:hypothetical protein
MRVLSCLLSLSIALTSLPSFASDADAKDLFARGRELRNKGDCAGAVPLFKKAFELWPQGLGSLRNLAECEEQLGHFASSRRAWLDLKRAVIVSNDSKYNGWEADADAAAARLAPKVARLTISLEQTGEGTAKVFVNKDAIDSKLLDVALDRDPGTYVVRAEGGKEPVEQTVSLVAGASKSVKLKVEFPEKEVPKDTPPPVKDDVVPPPIKPEPPVDTRSSSSSLRTVGWISIAVGGAAAIGTGIFIAMRASAMSDLEKVCPNHEAGPCGTDARDPIDRGKSAATMTNVFGAVAIIGLGAGIVILATAPSKTEAPKATMRIAPWASAGSGGAFLSGEF